MRPRTLLTLQRQFGSKVDPRFFRVRCPQGYAQPVPQPDDPIIVSMSSGVDSSVSALMYAQRFRNVRGVFMANWSTEADGKTGAACVTSDGERNTSCTVDEDWKEVKATCKQIGIPCERVNFEREYWLDVFEPMLQMYAKGWTPNPDVSCNKYIKFGKMIDELQKHYGDGRWWLVTGHYGKVLQHEATGEHHLLRADYRQKDQSYYLSQVPESALQRILLPMGHYSKPEVRQLAEQYNLVTRAKPDSQGLCFVSPTAKFGSFLDEYLPANPGEIVDKSGKVWGTHQGLWHATIGQRCGVSMPQGDPRYKGVWLVSGKDLVKNQLIISRKDDREAFVRHSIHVGEWQWMNGATTVESIIGRDLNCQIRSLQKPNVVTKVEENEQGIRVEVENGIFGVAPGQDLVLYDGDRVLGCGVIDM